MKPFILGVVVLFSSGPLWAAEQSPACQAKRAEIERGISAAEAHGNVQEVKGLKKALRANKAHCTTALLEAERKREIAEASEKVKQRQAELEKAERRGDAKRIAKQRAKVEEARRKLAEAQQPLPQ